MGYISRTRFIAFNSFSQTIIYSERLTFFPLYCYNIVYNICNEAE